MCTRDIKSVALRRSVSRGFTLIEVMITVAIIAILAAIALPSYQESVRKGKRAQGRAALMELMQAEERWFTQKNTYQVLTLGDTSIPAFKTSSGDNGASPAYLLQAVPCDGGLALNTCVKLLANNQFDDPVAGYLELWSTGQKKCEKGVGNVCWP